MNYPPSKFNLGDMIVAPKKFPFSGSNQARIIGKGYDICQSRWIYIVDAKCSIDSAYDWILNRSVEGSFSCISPLGPDNQNFDQCNEGEILLVYSVIQNNNSSDDEDRGGLNYL